MQCSQLIIPCYLKLCVCVCGVRVCVCVVCGVRVHVCVNSQFLTLRGPLPHMCDIHVHLGRDFLN